MTKVKTVPVSMRLKPDVIARLENFAEKKGISKSAVVTLSLHHFISEEERRENSVRNFR